MIGNLDANDGLIYRLSPKAKLLALLAVSILLFAGASPLALSVMAGAVLAMVLLFCPKALLLWLRAWFLLFTIVVVALFTFFTQGPELALVALLRLGTLSLFAALVTTTTTAGQFIETITDLARPLEKLGLANARDIGLSIGLVIRFIPEVQARYRAVVDAHRARGLKLRPATIIVPMVINTVLSADEIANAIDARNIRAQQSDKG
jgi:biotin transport system permease protein